MGEECTRSFPGSVRSDLDDGRQALAGPAGECTRYVQYLGQLLTGNRGKERTGRSQYSERRLASRWEQKEEWSIHGPFSTEIQVSRKRQRRASTRNICDGQEMPHEEKGGVRPSMLQMPQNMVKTSARSGQLPQPARSMRTMRQRPHHLPMPTQKRGPRASLVRKLQGVRHGSNDRQCRTATKTVVELNKRDPGALFKYYVIEGDEHTYELFNPDAAEFTGGRGHIYQEEQYGDWNELNGF